MENSVILGREEEEKELLQHIISTRQRIESATLTLPSFKKLEDEHVHTPTSYRNIRRIPPPCIRCGTSQYVMPFHQSGAWICCNLELVGTEEEPAHYCGYTWHEEAPPLLCLRWRCKGGVRQLEYHFGELGFACRACGRFESLQSLKLPLSAPPRLQNLPSPPPTPKKKKQKERGKLSYESSYTERA